jgi:hypothetical protein
MREEIYMKRRNVIIPKLSKEELEAKKKMLANHGISKELLSDDEFVAKAYIKKIPPISEEKRIQLMINAGGAELCNSLIFQHPEHSRIINDSGTYDDDMGNNLDHDDSDDYLD